MKTLETISTRQEGDVIILLQKIRGGRNWGHQVTVIVDKRRFEVTRFGGYSDDDIIKRFEGKTLL